MVRIHKTLVFFCTAQTQYNLVFSLFTLFPCVCTLETVKQCKKAVFIVRIYT